MHLSDNRKIAAIVAAVVVSFLLFNYFHGSEKINYARLEAQYGVYAMVFGEIVPIAILLAAFLYCTKEKG